MLKAYYIPYFYKSHGLEDRYNLLAEFTQLSDYDSGRVEKTPITPKILKKKLETEREASSSFAKEIIAEACRIKGQIDSSLIDDRRLLNVKMFVNKKISQVTNNRQKIDSVANGLLQLFGLAKSESYSVFLAALQTFANNLLKQAVSQGYINSLSLRPLAIISCKVTLRFKEFYYILLATIFESSIYSIPKYINKMESQSLKEYKVLLGYKLINGNLEEDEAFFEKSCGIIALFSSLISIKSEELDQVNPFGVEIGWRWLASVCNLTPRLITPALLSMFVEICGITLYCTYGEAFKKLIEYIQKIFITMFPRQAQSYSARLNIVIENLTKGGHPTITPENQVNPS